MSEVFVSRRIMHDDFNSPHFGANTAAVRHRYALPPMLLGLLAPALVILIVDAQTQTNPAPAVLFYMIAIFGLATLAYVISLFEAGEVTRISVDRGARHIVVEKSGLLTRYETSVSFADIAAIRIETHCDASGFRIAVPVIVQTDRSVVPLPAGTTESDIVRLSALVGCA